MNGIRLNPPTERRCLRCGREDVWDPDRESWVIREVDDEKRAGDRFCLHEWDITGTHRPITR